MKNLIFSMLAMAAMVSCSSESDLIDEVNPVDGDKVEIKLNAGVVGVETKAAIVENAMAAFSNTQVALIRQDETAPATGMTWVVSTKNQATIVSGGSITLPADYKFYAQDGKNAYFVGYYPEADIASGIVAYTGIDGTKDILCTNVIDGGNQADGTTAKNLEFKHMLSQVEIQVVGEAVAASNFGKIGKVTLKAVPSEANLTIGATPSLLVKSGSTTADIILFDAENNDANKQTILTSATKIGSIPMLVPGLGTDDATKLVIEIIAANKTSTVNITSISGGLVSGQKHVITLTFKNEITATASIAVWGTGTAGSGEVQ